MSVRFFWGMGCYGLLFVTLSTLVVVDVYHRIIMISRDVLIFGRPDSSSACGVHLFGHLLLSEFVDANSTSWPSPGPHAT
jgi:hypothetical protein